jgi:predicted nucleic acid-binding protein
MTIAIIIIIVAVIAAGIIGYVLYARNQKKHTGELKGRFGPEYDRAVDDSGGRKQAEQDLTARQKRVEKLNIQPLGETQRQDYVERWGTIQVRFVDDPTTSVRDADGLVASVMKARGYPMATWDQRASDVSVDHPEVVANYRAGHETSQAMEAGKATTEQLRQAMVHYRTLFEDLLAPEPEPVGASS